MFEFYIGESMHGQDLHLALDATQKILVKYCAVYLFPANLKAYKHGGHHKHGGKAWDDLKPDTWKRKKAKKHNKILVETDATRSSLNCGVQSIGGFKLRVKIGVHTPYAKYLASGTGSMPARLPVDVTEKDLDEYRKRIAEGLGKAINGKRSK